MVTGDQVVAAARAYIDTPFHHQGRKKGVGIDCVGLLVCVAKDLGIHVEDYVAYSMRPDGIELISRMGTACDPIPHWLARPGDIYVFEFLGPAWPQHAGFVTGGGTNSGVIHTYSTVGKVVEHPMDKHWHECLHSAWRFKGVA